MRFREYMAANEPSPPQPQRRPGGMTIGQFMSGDDEYQQGLNDARRGSYKIPKHYGGSQLSGYKRGKYLQGWFDGGGSPAPVRPLDWIHADSVKGFSHFDKVPDYTDQQLAAFTDEMERRRAEMVRKQHHGH